MPTLLDRMTHAGVHEKHHTVKDDPKDFCVTDLTDLLKKGLLSPAHILSLARKAATERELGPYAPLLRFLDKVERHPDQFEAPADYSLATVTYDNAQSGAINSRLFALPPPGQEAKAEGIFAYADQSQITDGCISEFNIRREEELLMAMDFIPFPSTPSKVEGRFMSPWMSSPYYVPWIVLGLSLGGNERYNASHGIDHPYWLVLQFGQKPAQGQG
ncbi:MAG: hypothetical protein V1735_06685 [Nanoarchaeota archaeon]